MKKLLALSLLMATTAWANPAVVMIKKPDFSNLVNENSRCYDIDMAYFNQCDIKIKVVFNISPSGRVTQVFIDDQGNQLDRTLHRELRSQLLRARFAPVSESARAVLPLSLHHQKLSVLSQETADELRNACTTDDACDNVQLEMALQKTGF